MAPSALNEARRELAHLRSMIDEARRDLGIEVKPAPIAAKRSVGPRREAQTSEPGRRRVPAA